ncbi:hypothetical protein KCU95_g10037, partial [Aureobasidium melanogenum]
MSTPQSPRSRIPIRAKSCPSSPKPRHISLAHSALITIHETPQQKDAPPKLTRMPRVRSCDSLCQRATDKVLPHLPQPNDQTKDLDSVEPLKLDENVNTSGSATSNTTFEAEVKQLETQSPPCTISASEAAWQDHLSKDQKTRKWKLCTSLQIVLDQHNSLLADIKISSAKAECLVSLLNDVAGNNQRLRYLHQRAMEQSRVLDQQSKQLASASNLVLTSNKSLIDQCESFLKTNASSYDFLLAEKEKSFQHAMNSKTFNKDTRVPKNEDLYRQNKELAMFVASLTTLLDTLESINVLLLKHKDVIDAQILEFRTTMAELVQKKNSSSMSVLFKFSCFR